MNFKKLASLVLVTLVVAVVIFSRFWKLGSIPNGLNIDEASYGYDAYSILHTHKDQWGVLWPQNLKSFGDYKPAALSYLIAAAIPIFDLSTIATRLPSAVAGLIILVFLYLTLEELSPNKSRNIFLTLIFAFSPWVLGISRLFYESNVGLLFYSIGIWLSIRSFRVKSIKNLFLVGISLGISGYFYEGLRFTNFFTVLLVALTLYTNKSMKPRQILFLIFSYIFISSPLLIPTLRGGLTRIRQESNSQSFGDSLYINENREMCYLSTNKNVFFGKVCTIWWNKPEERFSRIIKTLVYQTGPVYLFLRSTQDDIVAAHYGSYLWILFPVYLLGLLFCLQQIVKRNDKQKISQFLLISYLLGCLPGALVGEPMIHRNVSGLYISFIIMLYGYNYLEYCLKRIHYGSILKGMYLFLIFYCFTQFIIYYFFVYTNLRPDIWHSDSDTLFSYVEKIRLSYDKVYFSSFENAPLYYAFYTKFDPTIFQQHMKISIPDDRGWIDLKKLENLESTKLPLIAYLCMRHKGAKSINSLYIGVPEKEYTELALIHTYSFRKDLKLHDVYDIDQVYERTRQSINYNSLCKK